MSEKKEKVLKQESIPPMGLKMIFREFLKDKMAIFFISFVSRSFIIRVYRLGSYRSITSDACQHP